MEVQAKVAEIALPVALLYATHAHSSVALAAHMLFCAIVRHADVVCAACLVVWVDFYPTGSLQNAHVACAASGKSVCLALVDGNQCCIFAMRTCRHHCQVVAQWHLCASDLLPAPQHSLTL